MPRLMSVAFTEHAVVERRKTVTRRKGWWTDKNGRRLVIPGDHLTLCRKVMGRKPSEPLVRLVDVEVIDVRREPLCAVAGPYLEGPDGNLVWPELVAEGFPDMTPEEFMDRHFVPQGIGRMDDVTRIEWRYLEVHAAPPVGQGLLPCCSRPPFEVETWHRLTYDAAAITCPGSAGGAPPHTRALLTAQST